MAAANVVLPLIFKVIGVFERYERQDTAMTVEIIRSFFMRIGTIYAVCLALLVLLRLVDDSTFRFSI